MTVHIDVEVNIRVFATSREIAIRVECEHGKLFTTIPRNSNELPVFSTHEHCITSKLMDSYLPNLIDQAKRYGFAEIKI